MTVTPFAGDGIYPGAVSAATASRTMIVGPEAFFDLTSNWDLGVGTFELKRSLSDHAAQHYLYWTLALPMIKTALNVGATALTCLTRLSVDVGGTGFSGVPTNPARFRLYHVASGTIYSISDPAASAGALNARRDVYAINPASDAPLVLDATDKYLVEFGGPFAGSGYGTYQFFGLHLDFGIQVTVNDGSNLVAVPEL